MSFLSLLSDGTMIFVALISPAVPVAPVPTPNEFTCAFELVVNPPAAPVSPLAPAVKLRPQRQNLIDLPLA